MARETSTQRKRRLEKEKQKRQQESEASKLARLAKRRERAKEVSEMQRNITKSRGRMACARLNETVEAHSSRRARDALRRAEKRANETPDERKSRLARDALRHAQARANETPDERRYRLVRDAFRRAQARAKRSGTASVEKKRNLRKRRKRKEGETKDNIPLHTTTRTKKERKYRHPTPSTSTQTCQRRERKSNWLYEKNTWSRRPTAPLVPVGGPRFLSVASLAPSNNSGTSGRKLNSGTTSKEKKRTGLIPINRTTEIKEKPIGYQPIPSTSTGTANNKFILLLVTAPQNPVAAPQLKLSFARLAPSKDLKISDGALTSENATREEEKKDHPLPLEPDIIIKEEPIDYEPTPSTEAANDEFILPHDNIWTQPVATPSNPVVDPLSSLPVASLAPSKDPEPSDDELARKKRKIETSTFVPSTNGPDVREQSPVCNIGDSSNPDSLKQGQKDRFDVFGEFIAGELRSLDDTSSANALKSIEEIVIRAKKASLPTKTQDAKISGTVPVNCLPSVPDTPMFSDGSDFIKNVS